MKKCKHQWQDLGLGYFVTDTIFQHDSDSMISDTHEFRCELCFEKKYESVPHQSSVNKKEIE